MKDYIRQVLKTQCSERSIVIHVSDSKQKNEKAVNQKHPETSKILWFFRKEEDDNNWRFTVHFTGCVERDD